MVELGGVARLSQETSLAGHRTGMITHKFHTNDDQSTDPIDSGRLLPKIREGVQTATLFVSHLASDHNLEHVAP